MFYTQKRMVNQFFQRPPGIEERAERQQVNTMHSVMVQAQCFPIAISSLPLRRLSTREGTKEQ